MFPSKKTFNDLIDANLIEALHQLDISTPTPIQTEIIPLIDGQTNNLVSIAPTGTGKTLAYVLPLLKKISTSTEGTQLLVLVPTRELALQVVDVFQHFCSLYNFNVLSIIGGIHPGKQLRLLKNNPSVIVGTVGRTLDFLEGGHIKPNNIAHVIFDEGDKMFDMGFRQELEIILKKLPQAIRMYFFSATITTDINTFLKGFFNEYQKVIITKEEKENTLQQQVYFVDQRNKKRLLLHFLPSVKDKQLIIFCNTKKGVNFLEKTLKKEHYNCMGWHGGKPQSVRSKALLDFKEGNISILIATDVAARGIDIDDLELLLNYEVSKHQETFIHRIGRTARAGKSGVAIHFVDGTEKELFHNITSELEHQIEVIEHEFPQLEMEEDLERDRIRKINFRDRR
ncbi:DEAD/DEAH box helicase [Flammeovirga pacifica]|uniref:RNA helicase n=1 Tax=Flammeovirga pacifica TaxID=915059 RepID=A0A1S1YZF4_FLAPC|nr:DEAD/DEAH box helicase [Flammeovirga pacifica]OHX66378.1 hypothetical protein NH26_08435 [Flammeovirga pacifica]